MTCGLLNVALRQSPFAGDSFSHNRPKDISPHPEGNFYACLTAMQRFYNYFV